MNVGLETLMQPVEDDLPYELDRFVGRDADIEKVASLRLQARLLTLTGPGGVGKSRLALRIASQARSEFRDGVLYLDASAADTAKVLIASLASRVGLGIESGLELVTAAMVDRELLLLLDNCSRVVTACAELVSDVLRRCPAVRVIATSSERLSVPGEVVYFVSTLPLPDTGASLQDVARSDAAQLLVERLIDVNPHFVLDEESAADVAAICRRLDGLPLALELAAVWINTLSLREIVDRLDDPLGLLTRERRGAPPRHRTLRATLEWNTATLSERERRLLRRLAVFADGWDLDAARAICVDDDLTAASVLPVLADLVGKSLVQVLWPSHRSTARYRLFEVVRQYALEMLADTGEAAAYRERHAAWYAASIDVGEARPEQLDALIGEQDNLQTALEWSIAAENTDQAFALGMQMHAIWYIRGQFREALEWFERLLAMRGGSALDRTLAANWASMHALSNGDLGGARRMSEMARQSAAKPDDPVAAVFALDGEGTILLEQGSLEEAARVLTRELELLQDLDMGWMQAAVQYRRASICLESSNDREAERLCFEALRQLGTDGNAWIRLRVERVLGQITLQRGDFQAAEARFGVVLQGARQLGDLQALSYALMDLAGAAHAQRHLQAARQLVREALELVRRDTAPLMRARILESAATLLASARPEGCVQIVAAATRLRVQLAARMWPLEQERLDRALQVAHGRLSTSAAAIAAASGEVIDAERAVQLAHELLESLDPGAAPGNIPAHDILTPRELAVAELASQGLTNRAIAKKLVISQGTVRAHIEHILSKLGLRSRTEMARRIGQTGQSTPESAGAYGAAHGPPGGAA